MPAPRSAMLFPSSSAPASGRAQPPFRSRLGEAGCMTRPPRSPISNSSPPRSASGRHWRPRTHDSSGQPPASCRRSVSPSRPRCFSSSHGRSLTTTKSRSSRASPQASSCAASRWRPRRSRRSDRAHHAGRRVSERRRVRGGFGIRRRTALPAEGLDVAAAGDVANGAHKQLHVLPERPVRNVEIVEPHHLLHRYARTEDLPRTRHAGRQVQPAAVEP